jgi:hypothetical protein
MKERGRTMAPSKTEKKKAKRKAKLRQEKTRKNLSIQRSQRRFLLDEAVWLREMGNYQDALVAIRHVLLQDARRVAEEGLALLPQARISGKREPPAVENPAGGSRLLSARGWCDPPATDGKNELLQEQEHEMRAIHNLCRTVDTSHKKYGAAGLGPIFRRQGDRLRQISGNLAVPVGFSELGAGPACRFPRRAYERSERGSHPPRKRPMQAIGQLKAFLLSGTRNPASSIMVFKP